MRTDGAEAGAEVRDEAGVIAPPPLIYLAALAIGFGLEALLPSFSLPRLVRRWVGAALIAAGLGLIASFLSVFSRARTPVDVRKPTTTVVTTGPYRLTRNPGYLGLTLVYVGVALASGGLWVLVPLLPTLILIDRGVIRREERYLARKFGEEYLRYKRQTRRWL